MAQSEVLDAAPGGFSIRSQVTVPVERAVAWEAFVSGVGHWWNPDHTISGDPATLSIEPRPMGCFCETVGPGAGMVHMTVTLATPPSMLRLTGGLGPLGLAGIAGNMTIEFRAADAGTDVVLQYVVGGYDPQGLDAAAPAVDRVLDDALRRFADYAATTEPAGGDEQ